MEKVILTELTRIQCMDHLTGVTTGTFTEQHMCDVDPMIPDKTNVRGYKVHHSFGEVREDLMYRKHQNTFYRRIFKGEKPMIYVTSPYQCGGNTFFDGDVFYLFENEVRIDAKHSSLLFSYGDLPAWNRDTIVYTVVTLLQEMSHEEIAHIQRKNEIAQQDAVAWDRFCNEDLAEELTTHRLNSYWRNPLGR